MKSVLRRASTPGSAPPPPVVHFGDIAFDREGHTVSRAGRPLNVTPMEFRILQTLIEHPGRTFTRAQLLDAIAGDGFDAVDRHVANIRQKLEADPAHPQHLVTVFGVGYKFAGCP